WVATGTDGPKYLHSATRGANPPRPGAENRHSRPSSSRGRPARRMRSASPQIGLVPGAGDMRFRKCNADSLEFTAVAPKRVGAGRIGELIENMLGQKLGRCIVAVELRQFVQIAIIQGLQCRLERFVCAPDIDDDAVGIERFSKESCIDDECRAVHRLRRTKDGSSE